MTELKYMVHLHREGQQASRDSTGRSRSSTTEAVHDVGSPISWRRSAATGRRSSRRRPRAPAAGAARARAARLILAELRQEVDRALADGGALERVLADVEAGRVDAYTAIRTIAERPARAGGSARSVRDARAP